MPASGSTGTGRIKGSVKVRAAARARAWLRSLASVRAKRKLVSSSALIFFRTPTPDEIDFSGQNLFVPLGNVAFAGTAQRSNAQQEGGRLLLGGQRLGMWGAALFTSEEESSKFQYGYGAFTGQRPHQIDNLLFDVMIGYCHWIPSSLHSLSLYEV